MSEKKKWNIESTVLPTAWKRQPTRWQRLWRTVQSTTIAYSSLALTSTRDDTLVVKDGEHALQAPQEHHPSATWTPQHFRDLQRAWTKGDIGCSSLQNLKTVRFIGVVESSLHERCDIDSSWSPILWTVVKTVLEDGLQILHASPVERCSPIRALCDAVINPDTDLLLRLYPLRYLANFWILDQLSFEFPSIFTAHETT